MDTASFMNIIKRIEHRIYLELKRARLKRRSFTILCDNCNGGFILHDMRLRFNTPTINLWFYPEDYLRFLSNLERYLAEDLLQIADDSVPYPVGMLGDVKIYFMHYDSFEQAKAKWEERVKRIDWNHLYVMMTEKNGCTYEQLKQFDALPFAHKCVFTHKPYSEIKSACYIKGFENKNEIGILSDRKTGFWQRRWLDDFDYVSFLNQD